MKPAPYGPFPYSPIIRRPRLTWPDGAHVALWVIPNIEFFSLTEKVPAGSGGPGTPVPDIPSWSARDYGNRVGVFRLMQALDRHGIRATVALNSDLCAYHPEIIDMICRQFDVLYREGAESGRVMAIALHPYLTGVPHRIDAFDAALGYICGHARVWKATGAEIARHYRAQIAKR